MKEQGKHEDLMEKEGLYWDLWNSQATIGVGQGAGEGETAHSVRREQETVREEESERVGEEAGAQVEKVKV